jgi:hypothetical protein
MDVHALREELERSRNDALALAEQLKVHVAQAEALSSRIARILHQMDDSSAKDYSGDITTRPTRR